LVYPELLVPYYMNIMTAGRAKKYTNAWLSGIEETYSDKLIS